jgi:hypothetical protein
MEISQMSKIIGAAAAVTVMVAAIVAWSKVAVVKPGAAEARNAVAAGKQTDHLSFRRHDKARQKPSSGRLAPSELMWMRSVPCYMWAFPLYAIAQNISPMGPTSSASCGQQLFRSD